MRGKKEQLRVVHLGYIPVADIVCQYLRLPDTCAHLHLDRRQHLQVALERSREGLFDGLDFDALTSEDAAWAVLRQLADRASISHS